MSEGNSLFVKNNKDVIESDSGIYYWLVFVLITYTVLLFCQYVTILNGSSLLVHSWFQNPSMPGVELTSTRGWTSQAVSFKLIGLRVFFLLSIGCLIITRTDRGMNRFWLFVISILFITQILALLLLSVDFGNGNKHGHRYAMSSDKWYCCSPEKHANPSNKCTNDLPCQPPVPSGFSDGDLTYNENFLWLYWINFFLFIFDASILGFLFVIGYAPPEYFKEEEGEQKEEEEKKEDGSVVLLPASGGNQEASAPPLDTKVRLRIPTNTLLGHKLKKGN